MFNKSNVFSGFSVDDISAAKTFYTETLGLTMTEDNIEQGMGFGLTFANGGRHFIYPKSNHTPASFTVLNFPVDDIDTAVDKLVAKGIVFERYGLPFEQDEKGIARGKDAGMGPDIAWFKDPAGNVLAVLSEQ